MRKHKNIILLSILIASISFGHLIYGGEFTFRFVQIICTSYVAIIAIKYAYRFIKCMFNNKNNHNEKI